MSDTPAKPKLREIGEVVAKVFAGLLGLAYVSGDLIVSTPRNTSDSNQWRKHRQS
jgi:hypothetical protein